MTRNSPLLALFLILASPSIAAAQQAWCEEDQRPPEPRCDVAGEEGAAPDAPALTNLLAHRRSDPYREMAAHHRLSGNASYYSAFFDGRKTANGEIYRNASLSAAHLTLPLGCWVEVRSKATGRVLRLRVNDRGPYSGGFVLDLSRAAARALGVDVAEDRRVDIRVIAMPGEDPADVETRIDAVPLEELETEP